MPSGQICSPWSWLGGGQEVLRMPGSTQVVGRPRTLGELGPGGTGQTRHEVWHLLCWRSSGRCPRVGTAHQGPGLV